MGDLFTLESYGMNNFKRLIREEDDMMNGDEWGSQSRNIQILPSNSETTDDSAEVVPVIDCDVIQPEELILWNHFQSSERLPYVKLLPAALNDIELPWKSKI